MDNLSGNNPESINLTDFIDPLCSIHDRLCYHSAAVEALFHVWCDDYAIANGVSESFSSMLRQLKSTIIDMKLAGKKNNPLNAGETALSP